MTRLTETDVRELTGRLPVLDDELREVCGLSLRDVALRTASTEPERVPLAGARCATVPISTGEGLIPGFCECVAAILRHVGCETWVTRQGDVRGLQEAADQGAEVLFVADDHRFIALDLRRGRAVDDDPATADGYVTVLEAAAAGLEHEPVLLLGLGPVGRAAARRLLGCGARVLAVEPDRARLDAVLAAGLPLEAVTLADGLRRARLVFDATPAAGIIDAGDLPRDCVAAAPGIPSAFTPAAQASLGVRHVHEPLAIGVAVMAARALA